MRVQQPPQQIQPLPDQAVVVFLRPSNYGRKVRFTIVDGQGNWLGNMQGRQYFVTTYPPGQYEFVVHAENNDLMQANLTAGRVYYVLVGVRMGAWSARASISALTPRRDEWANLDQYIAGSRQLVADMAAGNAAYNQAEILQWVDNARTRFSRYDANEQSLRVLGPADGVGPGPQVPAPQPTQGGAVPVQDGSQQGGAVPVQDRTQQGGVPVQDGSQPAQNDGVQPAPTAPTEDGEQQGY